MQHTSLKEGSNMKILKLTTALLALSAVSAHAGGVGGGNADSNWTIYGWQNWSYEFVDNDERKTQRINNNAANIGFSASLDTGASLGNEDVKVNFQCEQFTFHNRFNGASDFCNRNSKISLSGSFGEVMFGQWLLPYNEMVAQWVDPFYDAGADSHTSIMGNIGYSGANFYNGSGFGDNNSFNRRQEEIVQYFSPNFNGLSFRLATTNHHRGAEGAGNGGSDVDVISSTGESNLDPRIWSMGAAYEQSLASGDSVWFAVTHERHDEWSAVDNECSDSDDQGYRIAGRYIHNIHNGGFVRVSAMWERLEYDLSDCNVLSDFDDTGSYEIERDAWMLSGVVNFGNGFDVRASYMNADELEIDSDLYNGDFDNSDADAFNLGVFYTLPAGTEFRATYSEVNNSQNSNYDVGINGTGVATGDDVSIWAVGIVQWF